MGKGEEAAAEVERLGKLANEAYWKRKDLPEAIEQSRAGIMWGMTQAEMLRGNGEVAEAERIESSVKGVAYNLAAFTWPGWNEAGIVIGKGELEVGREAAELNHRLAVELRKPAAKVGIALWMVGAHEMARGELDRAIVHFEEYGRMTDQAEHREVARGYAAMARMALGMDGQAEFESIVGNLKEMGTEDGTFFAEQLVGVRRVFVKG